MNFVNLTMLKKFHYLLSIAILGLLMSCKSSSGAASSDSLAQLEQMASFKLIEFKAEYALPLLSTDVMKVNNALLTNRGDSPGRIMLSKGHYMKIKQERLRAELPFFGEVRNSGYNTTNNGNIDIDNTIRDYSATIHKNKILVLKFKVKSKNDDYNVILEIFPSKKANLSMSGTRRAQIRYMGQVDFFESPDDLKLD